MIACKNHELYTQRQTKVALSACDDKIYINDET